MARDYYAVLGVNRGASDAELKRAYRKLARELHPDVNPDEAAQERFREVTTAYEVLSDPEKRRIVDAGGDPMASAGAGGFGGFGGAGFSGGINDVFEAFFGAGAAGGPRGPRGRVQPGADALLRMRLDLDECAAGVSKEVTVDTAILCDECSGAGTNGDSKPVTCDTCHGAGEVQSVQRSFLGQVMTTRPCPTCAGTGETIPDPCHKCGGDGRVRSRRTMTVKIPAGVGDGMRVRLQGQGEVGPGGGPAGDLYVEISEQPHERFVRDGDDLHCTIRVPMVDAALGTELTVPTILGGEATVKIDAGTQPGSITKIRGQGMPHLHTGVRGNLHAHLDISVPTKLDKQQTEKLKAFRAMQKDTVELVDNTSTGRGRSRMRNMFTGR